MKQITAKQLCKQWGLTVKHQLYRKNGTWFHLLVDFPSALLDENGYILFPTQADFENCPGLIIGKKKEKNWANCPAGISTLAGYVRAYETVPLAEEIQDTTYNEGAGKQIIVNAYERNAKARAKCIETHGTRCAVCDFDFGEFYGAIGEGFIHVHHLKKLSEIGEQYQVNPETDLRPVCPNCHAMLHRKSKMLTVEELQEEISDSAIGTRTNKRKARKPKSTS